ncbi:Rv0909 family putative TA system antitoxin [Streptomyces alboflavus]|uniref:Rv0909 family putative TA system antitoxin n=1 Tax=Streptomyces alboflavus TaxID=67267 RepID=UPI0036840D6C
MGVFDRFKDQAKDISDAAEAEINEKTGGKYEGKVDSVQQQVNDGLGLGGDKPQGR